MMQQMAERLSPLRERIDNLSLRERGITFLALIALLYLTWSSLFITPMEHDQKGMLGEIRRLQSENRQLDEQAVAIVKQSQVDPNAALRREIATVLSDIERLEGDIKSVIDGLVTPLEMARALERILHEQQSVEFIRLENLATAPLITPAGEGDSAPRAEDEMGIYQHTMRLELRVSYQSALDYLLALEKLGWSFYWDQLELQIEEYPQARMVLVIKTLSLEKGWIGA